MTLPGCLRCSKSHRQAVARIAAAVVYRWKATIPRLATLSLRHATQEMQQYVRPMHGEFRLLGFEHSVAEDAMVVTFEAGSMLVVQHGVRCERMHRVRAAR